MKTVRSISRSKNAEVFHLAFDGGEKLTVGINQIADYSLYAGRELTDEEYSGLKEDASRRASRAAALRAVSARPMSRRELADRLVQKGESKEAAEETAEWMAGIGAIDDRDYAGIIVRHYAAKGYGIGKIKYELGRRGIPEEYREEVLSEMPGMEEKIDGLVTARLRGKTPDRKELKRVSDALMRRGFTWDEIKSALKRYETMTEDCD